MRQPLALRVAATILLGGFTFMLAVGSLTSGGALLLPGLLAALVGAFVTVRNWRLRVAVRNEGLLVANLVRTHTVAWAEVDRAVHESGVVVRLRSGQQVRVGAFTDVPGALPMVRRRNVRASKELQTAITRRRDN